MKNLAGRPPAPLRGITHDNGSMITDANEARDRWRRHFQTLFSAEATTDVTQSCAMDGPVLGCYRLKPTVQQVYDVLSSLNGAKGLGPDQLSASILQAGGWEVAAKVHEVLCQIIEHEYVPIAWPCGRLVILYKGKGSAASCDSYRGLLIADHIGKILTSLLQSALNGAYKNEVGEDQFGAVNGRGTALASLALRTFLDACRLLVLSCFVLFIDLSKVFDCGPRGRDGVDAKCPGGCCWLPCSSNARLYPGGRRR